MKSLPFSSFAISLCLLILSIGGCSSSSSPSASGSDIPGVGSMFSIAFSGGNSDTVTYLVGTTLTVDAAHGGSVIKLTDIAKADTSLESFETNGDLAIEGASWGKPGKFEILPFASHTVVTDTFYGAGAFGQVLDSIAAVYNGSGKPFVLNNQTYQTDSVTVFYTDVTDGVGYNYGYSFIPALGLFAYQNYVPATQGVAGSNEQLISYSPK